MSHNAPYRWYETMSKFCLALFVTVAFLCGFYVQHTGLPDSANSTTRLPGPERILTIKNQAPPAEENKADDFDPVRLADEMTRAAQSLSRAVQTNNDITRGTVEKGETISEILEKSADGSVQHYLAAARKVFSLRNFREGQPYLVKTDSGRLQRFEYEIDNKKCLIVEGCESPCARIEPIKYDIVLATAETTIEDNLFQAVADIGENPHLALKLVDLFGSEINFIRDLKEGDSFSALIEKRYRDGEYKGYGRILAARFTNKGKTYEAYLFNDGTSGQPQYYNRKGENLKKTLLQSPLAFTRITSRFTHNRKHPILGKTRPHLGVDYGAPTGTPVKAVGEGVVTKRGWGGGYGNQIIVRHIAGLESMYAHLSGFARGLKEGARVRQGQVIGFVGSTGLSTGPHLDFRLRQNGTFIDPTKAINPRGASVSPKRMAEFKKTVEKELAWLEGRCSLAEYKANSVVPEKIDVNEKKPEIRASKKIRSARQQKQAARKVKKQRRG